MAKAKKKTVLAKSAWESRLEADSVKSRPFAGHPPSYEELSDILSVLVHNRKLSKTHRVTLQNLVAETMNRETDKKNSRSIERPWIAAEAARLVKKKFGKRILVKDAVNAVIGDDTQDYDRVYQAYKAINRGEAKFLILVIEDDWLFTEAVARVEAMINKKRKQVSDKFPLSRYYKKI